MEQGPSQGGKPPAPGERVVTVRNLVLGLVVLCAFYGCSGGGFIPSGPHAMDSLALQRLVADASGRNGVSPSLVSAVIAAESGGDPSAVSRAGAAGLMQLMPETAVQYGVSNRFDPAQNVDGGCRYLHDLLNRYHHNVSLALAAYNAGPGAVDASHGIPPFSETRAYVARVTAALR
jgi:soluble lytic murein transglycosylase-like protein